MDPMANDQERLQPVSILVVEADPRRRRWIEHALSGGRYRVMTVASAKQGLQYLKRNRFDVVVMGGHLRAIGVTEWLSETRRLYPDLPVIVNQVKWPVGREYREGSPGGFQSLVRSLQSQDAALRERVEEVSRGREAQSPG
jgi:DNA-binding NtrC family response regulator